MSLYYVEARVPGSSWGDVPVAEVSAMPPVRAGHSGGDADLRERRARNNRQWRQGVYGYDQRVEVFGSEGMIGLGALRVERQSGCGSGQSSRCCGKLCARIWCSEMV